MNIIAFVYFRVPSRDIRVTTRMAFVFFVFFVFVSLFEHERHETNKTIFLSYLYISLSIDIFGALRSESPTNESCIANLYFLTSRSID